MPWKSPAGDAHTVAEAQIVASIELWMRAYPRRWREARGQEAVDLVVDLARPGAQRLDPRSAFDLVRGGFATRWRERPPPHTWLLYRMFDRRIPVAYRSWAPDDIDGLWYPMRRFLAGAWPVFAMVLFTSSSWGLGEMPVASFVLVAFMVVSSMFIAPEWYRSQARLRHVAPGFGEVPVEGALVAWDLPLQRVTGGSGLTWAMLLMGTTGAGSIVAALLAPEMVLTQFQLNKPEMGPGFGWDSVAAPMGGHRVVAVAILVVALGLSVVLGTVALLILPGALVALLVTRGADAHDLAGRDVWWKATLGRIPRVDRPAFGLGPQPGPAREGVVVQPPCAP